MAIKFFAFFFRQSVLSDVFGLNGRHHWQLRAAAQRCGAGGCRREATWILENNREDEVLNWIHPTKLSIQLQIREAANITDRNKVLAGKLDTNGSKRGHKFSDFAVKVNMINWKLKLVGLTWFNTINNCNYHSITITFAIMNNQTWSPVLLVTTKSQSTDRAWAMELDIRFSCSMTCLDDRMLRRASFFMRLSSLPLQGLGRLGSVIWPDSA